ncbi:hypothetical protein WN944_006634 [Citrus x changshan-huyou]|uniref:Uncharacterized protein n=1 Tax=Citrus x changshan-huyou TaxID=2935761 RepID=A0AAP0MJH5_9ROSI
MKVYLLQFPPIADTTHQPPTVLQQPTATPPVLTASLAAIITADLRKPSTLHHESRAQHAVVSQPVTRVASTNTHSRSHTHQTRQTRFKPSRLSIQRRHHCLLPLVSFRRLRQPPLVTQSRFKLPTLSPLLVSCRHLRQPPLLTSPHSSSVAVAVATSLSCCCHAGEGEY